VPRLDSLVHLAPAQVFEARPSTPLPRAPPRQARTHRRRVRTSALPEPRRLPSDRPRPCDRSGPITCALLHLQGPAQHPCRLPRAAPAPSRVWWSLQTAPFATTRLSARRAATEKMLLPDVCNRPTKRAPFGAFDSRTPCPLALQTLRSFGQETTHPGGASLDGDPPASASIAHRLTRLIGAEASNEGVSETPLGPGGRCDRQALRRCPPGRGVVVR
jgi:hypothetical protein